MFGSVGCTAPEFRLLLSLSSFIFSDRPFSGGSRVLGRRSVYPKPQAGQKQNASYQIPKPPAISKEYAQTTGCTAQHKPPCNGKKSAEHHESQRNEYEPKDGAAQRELHAVSFGGDKVEEILFQLAELLEEQLQPVK